MAAESSLSAKRIILKANDGTEFKVSESLAKESSTIKLYLDDQQEDDELIIMPIPNVASPILKKLIEYMQIQYDIKSRNLKEDHEDVKAFKEVMKGDDSKTMLELIVAADYLNVKDVQEFLYDIVVDSIKDMSVENVRKFFGVKGDFSPEEEADLREENSWAFE